MTNHKPLSKPNSFFGRFEPKETYIWLDGPRTFSFLDEEGQLCFAHWLQELGDHWQYVVVPVNDKILSELNNGELSLRDVLQQPRIYLVEVSAEFVVKKVTLSSWDALPEEALPLRGTMIRRELEPFFCVRAIGKAIRPGDIPASVIKTTVESAQKAIRLLSEYEVKQPGLRGKRPKALRQLYDMPTQKLQFASFEISFRSPFSQPSLFDVSLRSEYDEERSVLDRVCEHLRTGLRWLQESDGSGMKESDDIDLDLKRTILEAMRQLAPPANGAIEKTEVSGTALKVAKPVQLTRQDRKLVTSQQKKMAGPGIPRKFDQIGTIVDILGDDAEIHVDFKLFETLERKSCNFSEDLWEFYGEKFHVNQVIRVFGVAVSSKEPVTVLQIAFFDEDGNQLEEAT
jgi:hypothetical protein